MFDITKEKKNIIFKKNSKILSLLLIAVMAFSCLTGCGSSENSEEVHIEAETVTADPETAAAGMTAGQNICTDLSVPTQITKIGDLYFIVDCYHNQVIYNTNLTDPLNQWKIMTSDINMGHTVAGDGSVYLVDDTENNRVLVFRYIGDVFVNTQVFNGIGTRPHYIVYNEADSAFYVWSSMTGQMYVIEHDEGSTDMYISRIMTLKELDQVYVRSFTIDGDSIYLVSGNSQIIKLRCSDFKVTDRYAVPDNLAGMIQVMPVESGYYITVSTDVNGNQDFATIVYTEKLENLEKGQYTDIYSYFIGGGTPYYMGSIDGKYYLTEHRLPGHSIWSFDIGDDGMPQNVEAVY